MSKSFGNVIALEDRPADMYGKLMSISDDLMMRYYELLTVIEFRGCEAAASYGSKNGLSGTVGAAISW